MGINTSSFIISELPFTVLSLRSVPLHSTAANDRPEMKRSSVSLKLQNTQTHTHTHTHISCLENSMGCNIRRCSEARGRGLPMGT